MAWGFYVAKISSWREKKFIRRNEWTSAKYAVVCDICVTYMPACMHTSIHIQADLILSTELGGYYSTHGCCWWVCEMLRTNSNHFLPNIPQRHSHICGSSRPLPWYKHTRCHSAKLELGLSFSTHWGPSAALEGMERSPAMPKTGTVHCTHGTWETWHLGDDFQGHLLLLSTLLLWNICRKKKITASELSIRKH